LATSWRPATVVSCREETPGPKSCELQTCEPWPPAREGMPGPKRCTANPVANCKLGALWRPAGEGVLGPKSCEQQTWHPAASSWRGGDRSKELRTANLAPFVLQLRRGCPAPNVANGKLAPMGLQPGSPCSAQSVARQAWRSPRGMLGLQRCEQQIWLPGRSKLRALSGGCSVQKVANGQLGLAKASGQGGSAQNVADGQLGDVIASS